MTGQPRRFELWLDASDGSCLSCWGILWPDGTASLKNANHPDFDAATGPTLDAALFRSGIDAKLRRIVWVDEEPADVEHCVHSRAIHDRHHAQPVTDCPWCKGGTTHHKPGDLL